MKLYAHVHFSVSSPGSVRRSAIYLEDSFLFFIKTIPILHTRISGTRTNSARYSIDYKRMSR